MRSFSVAVTLAVAMLLGLVVAAPGHGAATSADETDGDDTGLHLLREAAAAGRTHRYTGVIRFVTERPGAGGTASALVEVSGADGVLTVREALAGAVARRVDPGSPAGGLAAPTPGMLDVLARNYHVVAAGRGTVCGRDSRIVEVRRDDGGVAARFWLDESSRLPLRRDVFDGRGRLTSSAAFVEVEIPQTRRDVTPLPGPAAARDEAELARLRARGWGFPVRLPNRLELFAARAEEPGYLYFGYSDGLSVVSIFVQRGYLDEERLTGWHVQARAGHKTWVRDSLRQEASWASGGHVYTVLADAPSDTVDAAIAALPHEREPGFWTRVARGAERLASWANPFA